VGFSNIISETPPAIKKFKEKKTGHEKQGLILPLSFHLGGIKK
jgi:hypothetical protein